ncbi:hypothetical protein LXL04_010024 [Taraxacum kok-saghyz]
MIDNRIVCIRFKEIDGGNFTNTPSEQKPTKRETRSSDDEKDSDEEDTEDEDFLYSDEESKAPTNRICSDNNSEFSEDQSWHEDEKSPHISNTVFNESSHLKANGNSPRSCNNFSKGGSNGVNDEEALLRIGDSNAYKKGQKISVQKPQTNVQNNTQESGHQNRENKPEFF